MMPFIQITKINNNMLISRNWLQSHFEIELPSAQEIAEKSMKIASEICVYTNDNLIIESIKIKE